MSHRDELVATGRAMREARMRAGLRLKELASRSGWSASLICKLEGGYLRGSPQARMDIAQALGVPVYSFTLPVMVVRRAERVVGFPYLSGWEDVPCRGLLPTPDEAAR